MANHPVFDHFTKAYQETGTIIENKRQIITVSGLPGVTLEEIVVTADGNIGYVFNIHEKAVDIVPLSRSDYRITTSVCRTGLTLGIDIPSGVESSTFFDALLNTDPQRLISPDKNWLPINPPAPGIGVRRKITKQLETGLTLIDNLIPLAHGQRELYIGDRTTGKTTATIQTLLNQAELGTKCIYAAIGLRHKEISSLKKTLGQSPHSTNIFLISSSADEPTGMIFATPYTAMTLAEHFRDQGHDVLVVLDDMSTHSKFYREISLLADRFPGKDSYPGDIFHIHARLLERAGRFETGSITCIPIVHTIGGNITEYIATNLMSITDGHVFFDTQYYFNGIRPAINPFLSVTRVGRQTLAPEIQALSFQCIDLLNRHRKAQEFSRFGSDMAPGLVDDINRGQAMIDALQQTLHQRFDLTSGRQLLTQVIAAGKVDRVTLAKLKQQLNKNQT